MLLVPEGLGAVAVAPQVRGDDREAFGQERRDLMPHRMRLGVAVEQQDRGAVAAHDQRDFCARGLYPSALEALEHVATSP